MEITDSELNDVAGGNIDLRGCLGDKQLFEHDLPSFFAQYINGLDIENFRVLWTNIKAPFLHTELK